CLPEINLCQPVWESFLNPTSIVLENRESTIEIGRPNKEINIFGVSRQTGMDADRVSAAEQEWYFVLPKQLDRTPVKRSTLGVKACCFSVIFHGNDTLLPEDTGASFHHVKRPAPNALPFRNRWVNFASRPRPIFIMGNIRAASCTTPSLKFRGEPICCCFAGT